MMTKKDWVTLVALVLVIAIAVASLITDIKTLHYIHTPASYSGIGATAKNSSIAKYELYYIIELEGIRCGCKSWRTESIGNYTITIKYIECREEPAFPPSLVRIR